MTRIELDLPVSAARAYAYLADPRHRPDWQSSLRAIADPRPADGEPAQQWTDVTRVPGVRPRMRVTTAQPPRRWAEEGTFGPFRARLALTFDERPGGCRVVADFEVAGLGLGPLLTLLGRYAVRDDLRRAGRILAGGGN